MMIQTLDVDTVRRNTMQRILSLTAQRDFLQQALLRLKPLDGSPIDSLFTLPLLKGFEDYTIEVNLDYQPNNDFYLRFFGGVVGKDEMLEFALAEHTVPTGQKQPFSYAEMVKDLELNDISVANYNAEIALAQRKLNQVIMLVGKYNNSAKRFNDTLNELAGLAF